MTCGHMTVTTPAGGRGSGAIPPGEEGESSKNRTPCLGTRAEGEEDSHQSIVGFMGDKHYPRPKAPRLHPKAPLLHVQEPPHIQTLLSLCQQIFVENRGEFASRNALDRPKEQSEGGAGSQTPTPHPIFLRTTEPPPANHPLTRCCTIA